MSRTRYQVWSRLWLGSLVFGGLVGCSSSSTAPADPFVGEWLVRFDSLAIADTVAPDSFALTIAKSGAGYQATFPDLVVRSHGISLTLSDSAASSGVTARGDTLDLQLGLPGAACWADLSGPVIGRTVSGVVTVVATACGVGTGPVGIWSGVKQ